MEFPVECFWYLLPGGLLHIIAFPVFAAGHSILRLAKCRRPRLVTVMVFQGYLLIAAMIANGIWSCAVWGRLYWSVDYTSDFSVFIPMFQSQIEYSWGLDMSGGLNGITLSQLNWVWFVFAAAVWILAFIATRFTINARRKQTGEQAVGCNRRSASSLNSESHAAVHPL